MFCQWWNFFTIQFIGYIMQKNGHNTLVISYSVDFGVLHSWMYIVSCSFSI